MMKKFLLTILILFLSVLTLFAIGEYTGRFSMPFPEVSSLKQTAYEAAEAVQDLFAFLSEKTGFGTFGTRKTKPYIQIPEEYHVIRRTPIETDGAVSYDYSSLYEELARALDERIEYICLEGVELSWPAVHSLDYSSFWVDDFTCYRQYGYPAGEEEPAFLYFYDFRYLDLSREEIQCMKAEMDAAAAQILSGIPDGIDDWTTAKYLHDALCRTVTYDHSLSQPHIYDGYGALVNHTAVCEGYAIAFHILAEKLGYYSSVSTSDTHAWTHMNVPSYDEYIDITWDDEDLADRGGDPYISYDYFFLKREEVNGLDSHELTGGSPYAANTEEAVPYNYHAHEGYLLYSCDVNAVISAYQTQYLQGSNYLTVRFAGDEDYETAKTWEQDGTLRSILEMIGYYEPFYYWYNDNVNTVNVGLYPP